MPGKQPKPCLLIWTKRNDAFNNYLLCQPGIVLSTEPMFDVIQTHQAALSETTWQNTVGALLPSDHCFVACSC